MKIKKDLILVDSSKLKLTTEELAFSRLIFYKKIGDLYAVKKTLLCRCCRC